MTGETFAHEVRNQIGQLGGAFMLSEQARSKGKELGTGGWGTYMLGRGAVLGDCGPAPVAAAFLFFPLENVTRNWEKARAVRTPAEMLPHYLDICHAWGRTHLRDATDLERLAELLERVVAAAPIAGLPLFAGWAAQKLPANPAERVAQLGFVLREFRGGCHGMAVLASRLTPYEAVLLGGGAGNAAFFGYPEPHPDVSDKADRRTAAEGLTDTLAARAWGTLGDEGAECKTLLDQACAAATAAATAS